MRWTITGALILMLFSSDAAGRQRRSSPQIAFAVGQQWSYRTRPSESESRILIQRLENDPKLGQIVHIRVLKVRFKTRDRELSELRHMPYQGKALRKDILKLEKTGLPVPADYLEGYQSWRTAFDAGKAGIFTASVAEVIEGMERGIANGR